MGRREARERATQAMFAQAMEGSPAEAALTRIALPLGPLPEKDGKFARELCEVASRRLDEIDATIAEAVEHWRPERLSYVDRAILRLAVCEILFFDDVPPRVTLNEYIDLSRRLGTDESPAFVNGVLDRVLKQNPADDLKAP